ncbi:hypothetical protein [Nonomuraea turcica]|uniref:hypothetical protein n=1 Tax=Nonomuraea sp. G32 TaxID=3067274 RepID=UPI00273A855C|nr:hypothetical protein [Nonomuraea sp. G32]MDP4512164.1 hypothetical protein [Nonomuraea sp. G32]
MRDVTTGSPLRAGHLTRTSVTAELTKVPADGIPGVHDLSVDGHRVRFQADTDRIGDVLARLAEYGVRDLAAHPPTLEELFMRHYR